MFLAVSTLVLLLFAAVPAHAETGDISVGVGLALAMDLPDPASGAHTRFGPGPSLQIPVRIELAPHANLRVNARADMGMGSDRVSWAHTINGEPVRFYAEDQLAVLVAGGVTVGPEVTFPLDAPVTPYLGAGVGVAWVGTYHSLGQDSLHLLDPTQNDPSSPKNLDPFTSQAAFLTDLTLGGRTQGPTSLWFELGYSNAWVGAKALNKTTEGLDARREAYGWNAARAGVGVAFAL